MTDGSEPEHVAIRAPFGVPLTHTQMGWIGMVSIIWAQLEFLVEIAIYHLRGQSWAEGRATKLPRDITKKFELLAPLAGDNLPLKQRRVVLEVCERGVAAAVKRNLAIHGNWMENHNIGGVTAVSWFKVTHGEPMNYLPHEEVPGLVIETANIALTLYNVLVERGFVPHGEIDRL